MGRKQRLKQQRRQDSAAPVKRARGIRWTWLAGAALMLAVGLLAGILYLRANQSRFLAISVTATARQLQVDLNHQRGRFTLSESRRLETVLRTIETLGSQHPNLDPRAGGHLHFLLRVADELIRQGQPEPGELDKLEQLLETGRRELAGTAPPVTPGP